METIKETPTPLSTTFFCRENFSMIQKGIRQMVKDKSGVSIDYQNPNDVFTLMRYVYINNASDHHKNIVPQIKQMNNIVLHLAVEQINTNLSQFYGYKEDLAKPVVPLDIPKNTSLYGEKIGYNNQIGI